MEISKEYLDETEQMLREHVRKAHPDRLATPCVDCGNGARLPAVMKPTPLAVSLGVEGHDDMRHYCARCFAARMVGRAVAK
jgi:hypothetical protein